jgi:energy-coupling factor transporter ATP-binding protein EcfA2
MRLKKACVRKYRSIRDSGWFDVEDGKTILVGPNEAGKTALLEALQQLNPPKGVRKFDPLRDYPRSEYNDITTGRVTPAKVTVVEAKFALEPNDKEAVPAAFHECIYSFGRRLDNTAWHRLEGGPADPTHGAISKDLVRLAAYVDSRVASPAEGSQALPSPSQRLESLTKDWASNVVISGEYAKKIAEWLKSVLPLIEEGNEVEESRYERLESATVVADHRAQALKALEERIPLFVLFSNYFRVRPLIHLEHLAQRLETGVLDDAAYDYGNKCLLQILGFSARELSNLGKAAEPAQGNAPALKVYRDQLDRRSYQLNAASVRLTDEIRAVWYPDPKRAEAQRLRVVADQQYLKVVVEDELGVEIELDQRSARVFSGLSPFLSSSSQKLRANTKTPSCCSTNRE